MKLKANRWLVGLMVLGIAAAGCGDDGDDDKGSSSGKSWVYGNMEPTSLTPGKETSAQGLNVLEGLFDRLTSLDSKGKVQMNQAESMESEDQKTWTIKVKQGLTFHNGEPVTAQSYVDAWNAAAYGPNGWANSYYFDNIEGYDVLATEDPDGDEGPKKAPKPKSDKMSGLKVTDPQTFTVTLTAPFSQFPLKASFVGFAPMPKAGLKDLKAYDQTPIGNGPFMMDGAWDHNRQIKLRRFAGYKGSRPAKSEGVTFKIYSNREAAFTDLRAGKVDFAQSIPPALALQAKRTLGDRYTTLPGGTMDYLEIPLYDKKFKNPELRKAISMAIDRKAIVKAVFNDTYKPTGTVVSPLVPGFRENACGEACTYNPAKAKALFDKAGGYEGTMTLAFSNQDKSYQQWMTDVANQLKTNLGIKEIKLKPIVQADYLGQLSDQKMNGPYRANWIMDYPSAENYLSTRCGPENRNKYDGKECNDLIQKGNSAKSLEESLPFYHQAEDVLLRDLPTIPMWNWQDSAGWSKKLDNVKADPYVFSQVRLEQVTVK